MNRITRHDLAAERRDHRDLHYFLNISALYLEEDNRIKLFWWNV